MEFITDPIDDDPDASDEDEVGENFDGELVASLAEQKSDSPVQSTGEQADQQFPDESDDAIEADISDESSSQSDLDSVLSSSPYGHGRPRNQTNTPPMPMIRGRGRTRFSNVKEQSETPVNDQSLQIPSPDTTTELSISTNRIGPGRYRADNSPGAVSFTPNATPGYYVEPQKKPQLSRRYEEKRMTPEERAKRRRTYRAPTPLIDYTAAFNHLMVVIDRDDSKKLGVEHARRLLQVHYPDLPLDFSSASYNQWIFGLNIYSIGLPERIKLDLLKMNPESIDNETNRPFWLTFPSPVNFLPPLLKLDASPSIEKPVFHRVYNGVAIDLTAGALTAMTKFFGHPSYQYRKAFQWSFRFTNDFFEIQSIDRVRNAQFSDQNSFCCVIRKISSTIIDRAAIIYLWNDGFGLYLNMKGNLHEFRRYGTREELRGHDPRAFQRQGLNGDERRPIFSTLRFRVFLKEATHLQKAFERQSIAENIEAFRTASLEEVQTLLKLFLEFFHRNRIHVCFGPVRSKPIYEVRLQSLRSHRFETFIQNYSWEMLISMGLRLQLQCYNDDQCLELLHQYSKKKENENYNDVDDRFYRLCIYLYRRSLEYHFLDFAKEIEAGIEEYRRKNERFEWKGVRKVRFDEATTSTAYIPSVVITPTTISVRPLKLCKLNRVLREERFGGCHHFVLVELRDEAQQLLAARQYRDLAKQIRRYLTEGFFLTSDRNYRYLHHSQSQVKAKQFWFYYHQEGCLSHSDAYAWMGNFDKERVVAKHTARIALCFTSSDRTIQIPAEQVTYARDIETADGKYVFSDGVGTISEDLRNEVQLFLKRRYAFSVLQIRYGGSKGTLSVDWRLNGQQYQMVLRDSMNKFTSDHDILEVCKLSAPRFLYLNRQAIVLMESRNVPDTNFLRLQNEHHTWLIRALLQSDIAFEVLQEKILPVFRLRQIARHLDLVRESFFMKLVMTCASNIVNELIDRTRIRISPNTARNMFGIVDEYGVLNSGEVFVQYTERFLPRIDEKNRQTIDELNDENNVGDENEPRAENCVVLNRKVVITKNPCHHPGDLRVFNAVDRKELYHLKDCVVFPQKGDRPHSNEISGSDLDGDEYVVIWLDELIPQTPNEDAYDYDSQASPQKLKRPITREDIIQVVMEVSEQDCLGTLSNLHLAYADREGIKSVTCTKLAGDISQEVDAAKTGKHPLSEEDLAALRKGLGNRWPDFMKGRGKTDVYPSGRILGKLYRSACRAAIGWRRALQNNALSVQIDPEIQHPNQDKYLSDIKELYQIYRSELLEIISVYRFQDEIDLFARGDTTDASGGGGARLKKGTLEDSAANEVKSLIERVRQDFFAEFQKRRKEKECCTPYIDARTGRQRFLDCETCAEGKLAKAACLYRYTYEKSSKLSPNSNRRIFSLPWYFAGYLISLKYRNRPSDFVDRSRTMIGESLAVYPMDDFILPFRCIMQETNGEMEMRFFYKSPENSRNNTLIKTPRAEHETGPVNFLEGYFIQILTDWLTKQEIFGNQLNEIDEKPQIPRSIWHEALIHFLTGHYQTRVELLSSSSMPERTKNNYRDLMKQCRSKWTHHDHEQFHSFSLKLNCLIKERVDATKLNIWAYLYEYFLLALQSIGVEKKLADRWICPQSFKQKK